MTLICTFVYYHKIMTITDTCIYIRMSQYSLAVLICIVYFQFVGPESEEISSRFLH